MYDIYYFLGVEGGIVRMEKVISLLFEIEEKAQQIIKRADEEKVKLYEELEKSLLQMENDITAENTAKLKALQSQSDMEFEKERKILIDNCNKQLEELDSIYKNSHDQLVDKVFESLICP
jgi:hypothetical protein